MKLIFKETDEGIFGEGAAIFDWRPGGNHIAVGGAKGVVLILDRYGAKAEEIRVGIKVDLLKWDRNGEMLAIVGFGSSVVHLFELPTHQTVTLDVSFGTKGLPTFARWSTEKPVLAVGTNQGNVLLFNHRTSRKIPIMGKHQRAIVTGFFDADILALGSEDQTVTINNLDGDAIATMSCNGAPSALQIARFRRVDTNADQSESFLSFISGRKTLTVAAIKDTANPISLQFQDKYGPIVDTAWYHGGMVVVGFEKGFLVVLSAQNWNEVNHELFSVQEFHSVITQIYLNEESGKLFTAGDNGQIKIRNLDDLNDLSDILESSDAKSISRISCSEDGVLTAVTTETPSLSVYLTRIPVRAVAFRNRVAILTSLTEVSIYDDGNTHAPITFNAKLEPSLIAVGSRYIAVAFNNSAWFYEIKRGVITFLFEEEYMTTVNGIKLNSSFAMVQFDRRLQLHTISGGMESQTKMFPDTDGEQIKNADLMDKFLIYSTEKNRVRYFSIADWAYACEFKHAHGITALFGEYNGIRAVFFDENYGTFLYHPADDEVYSFGDIQTNSAYKLCLWESFTVDKDSLLLVDSSSAYVFVISRNSHGEQQMDHIATFQIPYGNMPLSLSRGVLYCHTLNGKLNTILLNSHRTDANFEGKTHDQLMDSLMQSVKLKRWRNCWKICDRMNDNAAWNVLGEYALRDFNLELANRVYRHIGKVSMVYALDGLRGIEEENLLNGHILSILGDFDKADELFCLSSEPIRALEMRRNILDWDRALHLAEEIAPEEIPFVSSEYATQLEFMGQHGEALHYYERALLPDEETEDRAEHNANCRGGMARMSMRTGEIQRGVQLAIETPSRQSKRDCGAILEEMKLFEEAARVYEAGEFYDRAAASYIRAKNWLRISQIEEKVRSPKVLSQYGRLLLADKRYDAAFKIFERARNYERMILVLLKHLNRVDEAVELARECRSAEGARLVATHFTDIGDYSAAIEFLVLSQCFQEAYDMALSAQKMGVYATAVEQNGTPQQFVQLAEYFVSMTNEAEAGKFYGLAKDYELAIAHLLKAGDNEEAILNAIDFTAESGNSVLVDRLVHFLMGESDGVPKDPKYLFQMYTRMGMHAKAAKIAMIIANEQLTHGSYRNAHRLLFGMRNSLRMQSIRVPAELDNLLMILHSYIIVKRHVAAGNDLNAARLLIRVTKNISRFPMHELEITASAVISCAKAGLRQTAYDLSVQLLRNPKKDKLDPKYRRKIETIVRKADKELKDTAPILTACPQCSSATREFELLCDGCRSTIPYCVVTGKHIVAQDFALCPQCRMPAFYSELQKLSSQNEPCPMCGEPIGDFTRSNGADEMARANEKD